MCPTSRKPYRRIAVSVLALLIILVLWRGFVLLNTPTDHQKVQFADGTVVELLGYSFGKKHELRRRKPISTLHDIVTLFQPAPIIRAAETDQDVLLLWLRVPPQIAQHPGDPFLVYAKDAKGACYPSNLVNCAPVKFRVGNPFNTFHMVSAAGGALMLQGEEILATPVICYPHREDHFTVDLMPYTNLQTAVSLHIANPSAGRSAPFAADPLPATRQEQDLQVTLASIKSVEGRHIARPNGDIGWLSEKEENPDGVLLPGEEGRQRITLSYSYRGRPDPNWKISELKAFDAMGNNTREISPGPHWPCRNYLPPSTGEPYTLRLGVHKTVENHFDADELWTVSDIPLPTQGKSVPIQEEFQRGDLHLRLVSIYGMDGKNFSPDLAIVQIKVETPDVHPVLLLHVEDEQGRTVAGPWPDMNRLLPVGYTDVEVGRLTQAHTGTIGDADPAYRSVPLKIPKGVKRLKLVFKVPHIHFVEFVAPAYSHSPE